MFPNLAAPLHRPRPGNLPMVRSKQNKNCRKERGAPSRQSHFQTSHLGESLHTQAEFYKREKKSEQKIKLACKHLNTLKEKEKDAPLYKLNTLSLSGHSGGKEPSGKHVFAKSTELVLRCGVLECFWTYLIRLSPSLFPF